jgi:hypothetical protein
MLFKGTCGVCATCLPTLDLGFQGNPKSMHRWSIEMAIYEAPSGQRQTGTVTGVKYKTRLSRIHTCLGTWMHLLRCGAVVFDLT